ncbi:hypothetical protein [Mitsuokella sp.]
MMDKDMLDKIIYYGGAIVTLKELIKIVQQIMKKLLSLRKHGKHEKR